MKLPSGEKVSPVITVRCCLKERRRHEKEEKKKKPNTNKPPESSSNIECNTVKNPGEQNNQGQAEDPTMLTPAAAQDNRHSNFSEN